jgi:hypothetical protein
MLAKFGLVNELLGNWDNPSNTPKYIIRMSLMLKYGPTIIIVDVGL